MKLANSLVRFLTLTMLMLLTVIFSAKPHTLPAVSAATSKQELLKETLGKMSLCFIENSGQLDKQVAYYVQGRDKMLYFTPQGITFALANMTLSQSPTKVPARWIVKLEFLGANPQVKIVGKQQTATVFSYFVGSPEQWKGELTAYQSIVYEDLWPGIDLVYSGSGDQLKYEFVVQPGANPEQIRLAYRGVSALLLRTLGGLEVRTPISTWADDKPASYQGVNGLRVKISAAYALEKKSHEYRFLLGNYDRSQPLMIAPALKDGAAFAFRHAASLTNTPKRER